VVIGIAKLEIKVYDTIFTVICCAEDPAGESLQLAINQKGAMEFMWKMRKR